MDIFSYETNFLQASLNALEEYLLSDRLFWDLHLHSPEGEPPYPTLTLGCLLISVARLRSIDVSGSQQSELLKWLSILDRQQSKWRVAWRGKSEREFYSRLNQWRNYLHDVSQNPAEYSVDYGYTVRLRVMLDLLSGYFDVDSEKKKILNSLDRLVQTRFMPGDFIWEPELSGGFSKDSYWYLWGKLVE